MDHYFARDDEYSYTKYVIRYYSPEESSEILAKLIGSCDQMDNFLNSLDLLAEPLGDPSSIFVFPALVSGIYTVLRSLNVINDDTEKQAVVDFTALYCAADGYTPLCVSAHHVIYNVLGEWYEKNVYERIY